MSTKRSKKFGKASEMMAVVRFLMAVIGVTRRDARNCDDGYL
jgi:hypothetical protein